MSECRCSFEGRPVTGHLSYCPIWKDDRIAELEALRDEKFPFDRDSVIAELEQQLTELREAASKYVDTLSPNAFNKMARLLESSDG